MVIPRLTAIPSAPPARGAEVTRAAAKTAMIRQVKGIAILSARPTRSGRPSPPERSSASM